MSITQALERDPAFRGASWSVKAIYPQLRRFPRIKADPGATMVDSLVFRLRGLSATPRADVEVALDEMLTRGLLARDGEALVPKHAPRPPRATRAKARALVTRSAPSVPGAASDDADEHAAPEGVDARRWAAFRAWECRLPAARKALPFEVLWEEHSRAYRPRRRAAASPSAAPAVVTEAPPAAVTTAPAVAVVTGGTATTAVTSSLRDEEREVEEVSLSTLGNHRGTTFQPPPARDPGKTVVTTAVTAPTVTSAVTRAPAEVQGHAPGSTPAPPAAAPCECSGALSMQDLRDALRATSGRVGDAGDADRRDVLAILAAEEVTRAELLAFSRLAAARRLYLQSKHDRVSLRFLLHDRAAILHRWIDDVRGELGRQPALGLAANETSRGSDGATAPPRAGPVRTEPPPEQLAAAREGVTAALSGLRRGGRRDAS